MKIVLCNTLYPPDGIGGPERSVKITAEGLVKRGHDVTVIGQGFHVRDVTRQVEGVKRISIGCPPGYQPVVADNRGLKRELQRKVFKSVAFDLVERYFQLVMNEEPDVVHTNIVHAIDRLWTLLAEYQVPLVHTLRVYNLMCDNRMYFRGAECRYQCEPCRKRFAFRIGASEKVTSVVGISRYVLLRHLEEGLFTRTPCKTVIGNPYDSPLSMKEEPVRPSGKRPRLLFMGRIHPSKGIRLFVDLTREQFAGALRFRVCGRGHDAYVNEMQRRMEGANVEWLGFTPHDTAFADVDWLVVPSLWAEPFGRVVVEAFAHGVPVIASTRGAFPELIEHGKNGLLFDPDEPGALRGLVQAVSEHRFDHAAMSRAALTSAQLFSASKVAAQYEAAYEEAIDQSTAVAR